MNAKFRMVCNGTATCMELDGKTIGKGVESVEFFHSGSDSPSVKISIDLKNFSFMPDGHFDKIEKAIAKESPPEDQLIGRTE